MRWALRRSFCGVAALCLSLGVQVAARAGDACYDRYTVGFALKPAGESYFLQPDDLRATETLPLTWRSGAGNLQLILDIKRADSQALHVAMAKQTAAGRSVFLVRLQMDGRQPLAYRGQIVDQGTGDAWTLEVVPVCAPV